MSICQSRYTKPVISVATSSLISHECSWALTKAGCDDRSARELCGSSIPTTELCPLSFLAPFLPPNYNAITRQYASLGLCCKTRMFSGVYQTSLEIVSLRVTTIASALPNVIRDAELTLLCRSGADTRQPYSINLSSNHASRNFAVKDRSDHE